MVFRPKAAPPNVDLQVKLGYSFNHALLQNRPIPLSMRRKLTTSNTVTDKKARQSRIKRYRLITGLVPDKRQAVLRNFAQFENFSEDLP